uniref:HTH_Tnp_Tc3_1 domain-containing protein n=1 Tax=Caenorhabditis japonica TaxID=281687 RepID=K7I7J5_CAEJA
MGRAPLHTVAEQAQISVMHQLGSSLHMIYRYPKKSRSAIRSYLNNPLYYGKNKSTGRPRKVTSRETSFSKEPQRQHNEKSYKKKIPVGASRKSVLAQQQCGVELGP